MRLQRTPPGFVARSDRRARWGAVRPGAGLAFVLVLLGARAVGAFPPTLNSSGQADFTYGTQVESGGGPATGYKPESKLFYTADNRWWAVLGTSGGGSTAPGVHLYGLDTKHAWQPTLQLPGADPWEKADTLLDGDTLYVALRDNRSLSGNPRQSRLYELRYTGSGAWTVLSGPTVMTTANPETLTLARDSRGRLWTTYESSQAIRVGYTAPGGTAFTFTSLPTTAVDADDISTVIAFGSAARGYKIGVLWSDQVARRDWFAWRFDADPIRSDTWHIETAYGAGVGACPTVASSACADDHLNVKTSGDEVYAAVKTSLDGGTPDPHDPLIVLLRRDAIGTWAAYPVSPVSQGATRPIVLLAPALDRIWVFAARSGGVSVWESPFSAASFDSSASILWTKASSGTINNPTSTKQLVTGATGAVVETSKSSAHQYWHNEFLAR